MVEFVYVHHTNGAIYCGFKKEKKISESLEARLKLMFADIKDENIDEVD